MVRKTQQAYAEKGIHLLDAPVSGGPAGAKSGRLAIWVGGDKADFRQAQEGARRHRRRRALHRPDRRRLGGQAGPQLRGLCHPDGARGGVLDGHQRWRRAAGPVGGRAQRCRRALAHLRPAGRPFSVNSYDPPSFALKLAHKDMRLATELGRELGVPMRLANLAYADLTEALNRGWEGRDSRSPMLLQLERAGLKGRGRPQAHPGGARARSTVRRPRPEARLRF